MSNDPRYPIGKFERLPFTTAAQRRALIKEIAATPRRFRDAVAGLTPAQLETPYRDGGWTVRQVVHHVPDSHLNGYLRLKFAMTEESPAVMAFDEAVWSHLPDVAATPIDVSLTLLESLHDRWNTLLTSLDEVQFRRPLFHPEHGPMDIDWLVQLYAWHGKHHAAHITTLRRREGW